MGWKRRAGSVCWRRKPVAGRGGRTIPIIAGLTASTTPADRDRCIAAGMNDYLTKPVSKTRLLAVLQQFHRGDAPHQEAIASDRGLAAEAAAAEPNIEKPDADGGIQFSVLLQRFDGDEEFVQRLAATFRRCSIPGTTAALSEAMQRKDFGSVRKLASTLKAPPPMSLPRQRQPRTSWNGRRGRRLRPMRGTIPSRTCRVKPLQPWRVILVFREIVDADIGCGRRADNRRR